MKKRGRRRVSAKSRSIVRRSADRTGKRRTRRKKKRPPSPERRAYRRGYEEGLRKGREALLQQYLPFDLLIPDIMPEEAMAAGVNALRARGQPILFPPAIHDEIDDAIRNRRPYSFIRLGDGELLTLAQGKVLTDAEIRRVGSFLPYSGVRIPDHAARDELLHAVRTASLIGIPLSRQPYFQPLFLRILKAYGIDISTLRLTTSTMNYSLHDQGYLMRLLQERKVLVIGNAAEPLAEVLKNQGIEVAGTISPVRGFKDFERVVAKAAAVEFDLALVAAGIAAVPICVRIAERTGKAAIDFGHLANRMAGISARY